MSLIDDLFGTGDDKRYDSSNYTAPVHATDERGNDITVSFGKEEKGRGGETLISDGHVTHDQFYRKDDYGHTVGHDHFMGDGSAAGRYGDRGTYTGDK